MDNLSTWLLFGPLLGVITSLAEIDSQNLLYFNWTIFTNKLKTTRVVNGPVVEFILTRIQAEFLWTWQVIKLHLSSSGPSIEERRQAEPLYEAVVQNMETKNTDQRCEENYLFVSTQNDVITYVF